MAFTLTKLRLTVHGDERVLHGLVTADATTGSVATPFLTIYNVNAAPSSMSTAFAGNFKINEGPVATAIAGTLGITGVVSGDDIYVTIYGR